MPETCAICGYDKIICPKCGGLEHCGNPNCQLNPHNIKKTVIDKDILEK